MIPEGVAGIAATIAAALGFYLGWVYHGIWLELKRIRKERRK